MKKDWFSEELYQEFENTIGYQQTLLKSRTIIKKQTQYQSLEIFENPRFGKVLTLDGVVQTTSSDEFFYHEMFTHVPILSHGNVKKVLIIGGGDGGILRETLKHTLITKTLMIEIDKEVTEICKSEMPELNNGAFLDERAEVLFIDGIDYVQKTQEKFDLIIVDSTDPIGVAEVLFTKDFYESCNKCLATGGIVTTQSGVPFFQANELKSIYNKLKSIFPEVLFYIVPIPTYVGSFMCLSLASHYITKEKISEEIITQRALVAKLTNLKYYNPQIHVASFMLPEYIKNMLLN